MTAHLFSALEARRLFSAIAGDTSIDVDSLSKPETTNDEAVIYTMNAAVAPTPGATLVKGKLLVTGTANADTVAIALEGTTKIAVTFNGTKTTYDISAVKKIDVKTLGGNDTVSVALNETIAKKTGIAVDGGADNDTLSSNVKSSLVGNLGDDTLSATSADTKLSAGAGSNTVTYSNGDQDVGDMKLRTKNGVLTITGSGKADAFTFAQGTGTNINVTDHGKTATFNLANKTSIILNGAGGHDTATVPTGLFGTKTFSKKSIES